MRFLSSLFNWEEVSSKEYFTCYEEFGGNISSHPEVLNFIHEKKNCEEKYLIKRNHEDDMPIAAICIWGDKYLANDKTNGFIEIKIPVPNDEIIIPAHENAKFILPVKTKYLSDINRHNVYNATYAFNSRRSSCIVKSTYAKSRSNDKKINSFLKNGGEIIDCKELNINEVAKIYFSLTKKRWGNCPVQEDITIEFLNKIKDLIWGNILYFNGKPCAFNLTTKIKTKKITTIEFIHAGLDYSVVPEKYSPGQLLIYSNIKKAFDEKSDNIRYSFGLPTREYKSRWCNLLPLGRVIA